MLIVYLDAYHLGDPLFLRSFARDVQRYSKPLMLVHGGGEEVDRVLEAGGELIPVGSARPRPSSPEGRALVERTVRDLNRRIVHELNDAGVSALRVLGTDRGLLTEAPDGSVHLGRLGWVSALMLQRVVPVLGLLADSEVGAVEVAAEAVLGRWVEGLAENAPGRTVEVGILARSPSVASAGADALAVATEHEIPAVVAARELMGKSVRVRVLPRGGLRS